MNWNSYTNFSSEFLTKNRDLVLRDTLHHIKSYLLYPLNCDCEGACSCDGFRSKVVLSLNVHLYNHVSREEQQPETLIVLKSLLNIPEDHHFRELHSEAYPLWLIEQNLKRREAENHFKMVYELVWTLLRLAKTYELSYFRERKASINEALERVLGDKPLKSTTLQNTAYLGGEKAYTKRFHDYKSVCHFIAAFEYLKLSPLSLEEPDQIDKFLRIAKWFRENLLSVKTPNVKEKSMFSEEELLSLPAWGASQGVDIPVEPFEEKLKQLEEAWENAPTYQCTSEYRGKKYS